MNDKQYVCINLISFQIIFNRRTEREKEEQNSTEKKSYKVNIGQAEPMECFCLDLEVISCECISIVMGALGQVFKGNLPDSYIRDVAGTGGPA